MSGDLRVTVLVLGLVLCAILGCSNEQAVSATSGQAVAPSTVDPLATAAAQATAIVQQAQATALLLKARAEATAVVEEVNRLAETRVAAAARATVQDESGEQGAQEAEPPPTAQRTPPPSPTPEVPDVEVLSVGFAGEGGYIHVQFRAPVEVAKRWNQGVISVIDQETGTAYTQIPVMPKIGALIGRPARNGQPGYVMLVNGPVPLRPGALVTVVLGGHTFEHVQVQ